MKNWILLYFVFIAFAGCTTHPDASTPHIQTGVDTNAWALVPSGEYLSGQQAKETALDHDYEIMITDVTSSQYCAYLNEASQNGTIRVSKDQVSGYYAGDEYRGYSHEIEITAGDWLYVPLNEDGLRLNYQNGEFSVQPGYEDHPMTMVTWFGAQAYCEYHHWKLPTEIEWEKAARGIDDRAYPWGNKISPLDANYYSSHDLFEKVFGDLGDTTPVGFYNGNSYEGFQTTDAVSPYGLYDMAGNVWQWTGDIYPNQHYRYMRGGSKADYSYNLRIWMRNSASPDYFSSNVGFRCARNTIQ